MSVRLLIASEAAKEVWGLQPLPTVPTVSPLTCQNGKAAASLWLEVTGCTQEVGRWVVMLTPCTRPTQCYASPPQGQEYSLQGTPISSLFQGKV